MRTALSGIALGVATVASLSPGTSTALEAVLAPVADTTIYRGEGFSAEASNALGENLSVGQDAGGITRRSLIRFDLSAIGPGAIVHRAQLTLFEPRSRGNYDVSLHRVLSPWGEGMSNGGSAGMSGTATVGDATWEKARHPDLPWTNAGGDFSAAPSATTLVGTQGASYVWSSAAMAADAQLWVDQPSINFGWILIGDEITNQNVKLFGSRESGVAPSLVLEITPVPEPGSYVLMAIGVGLIGWRLRQRQRRHGKSLLSVA